MIDLDTVTADFLQQCGFHDYSVARDACTCPEGDYRPVMHALVVEVGQLRGDLKRALADRAALVTAVTTLRELETTWANDADALDEKDAVIADVIRLSAAAVSDLLDKIGGTRE